MCCVYVSEDGGANNLSKITLTRRMKMKFKKLVSFLLIGALGGAMLASCDTQDNGNLSYISLRINPEIEMVANEDGEVLSVNAVNDDAEVVLSQIDLEGMSIEEAGVAFTETAIELGYLDPNDENAEVFVGTLADGDATELNEKISREISDYFKNKGINGRVAEETLDKYLEKASEWGLSAGHTKLVMRALDANPELTDNEVIPLGVKGWIRLIKGEKGTQKIASSLRAEHRAAIDTLKEKYSEMFELRTRLEELETQLEQELTDEQRAELEAQIKQLNDELKPLHDEYKEKMQGLNEQYREASKTAKREYKATAEKRKIKKAA